MTAPPSLSDGRAGRLGASAAVTMWALGNVMVLRTPMDGLRIAFWRILLGAVVYWVALTIAGRRLTIDQVRRSAPAAIAIALEIAAFFVAIKTTTVANATVIGAMTPIPLLAVVSRRSDERVTRWLVGMAMVAVVGVAMVVFGSSSEAAWSPRGDLLAVVAMALFATYLHFAKAARATVPAFEFQTVVWIVGTVTLLPIVALDSVLPGAALSGDSSPAGVLTVPSLRNWGWLLALLAVPGTGHLLMNWAHSRVRLLLTSMLTLAIPVISTLGAWMALGQTVDAVQLAGMAVVVVVLGLVVRRDALLGDGG